MTQTGTVLGTSDYIAPEQAQGQRVDEHTDVYSLGVVLYELLTSEVPFPGENFVAVAMRHINEEPPSVRRQAPRRVAAPRRGDPAGDGEAARGPLPDDGSVLRTSSRRASPSCRPRARSWRGPPSHGRGGSTAPPLLRVAAARRARSCWPRRWRLAPCSSSDNNGNGTAGAGAAPAAPCTSARITAYDPIGGDGEHDADAAEARPTAIRAPTGRPRAIARRRASARRAWVSSSTPAARSTSTSSGSRRRRRA